MKNPKPLYELQDLVNEFSKSDATDEEFQAFERKSQSLVLLILKQELDRDDLEKSDLLFRQLRSVQSIHHMKRKLAENPNLFDDEFDYIEEKVQQGTGEKWWCYREYPIVMSANHGMMCLMFLESKPSVAFIYYLEINKFKKLGDPLKPTDSGVKHFVHSMITKGVKEALSAITTTD